ncbi:MAG TPA: FtsX-like permease family protein [Bdellovibrionota bacterium]|nr:FtsX-like permease family protein [Bdellovibrionota bacterium]
MKQLLRIAFRNLFSHRGRTLVLGGAIALVTTLVVVMLALTSGIRTRMIQNATALSTGHVNVGGFLKISQSSSAPVVNHAAKVREVIVKTVPEATLIVDRVRAWGKIISDENSVMLPMSGINMESERSLLGGLSLAEERDYIEGSKSSAVHGSIMELEKTGGIVLFASQAKKLKVRVGDMVTISMPTYRNTYNTIDLRVVAILKNLGMISSFSVFFHHKDARTVYDMAEDTTGVFQIYLPDIAQVPAVEERLRQSLKAANYALMDKDPNPFWMKFERVAGESWSGQRLDVTDWQDETSFLKWILDIFGALTFVLTLTLMFIVTIGLINNMWMSIRERTPEIGTMRAIGLQRRGVMVMFLFESLQLAALSVGAGVLAGVLIVSAVNALDVQISSEAFVMFLMSNSLWLNARPVDLAMVFLVLTLLLMIGAFIPAYRASKMKPITAINHVN